MAQYTSAKEERTQSSSSSLITIE